MGRVVSWSMARVSFSGGIEGFAQVEVSHREDVLVGTARGHGDADAAYADADLGADLQELEADRLDGSIGELGVDALLRSNER